jgi:hypothetical protein
MFVGQYSVPIGGNPAVATEFQSLIDIVETRTIKELFGNTMGTAFLADISSGVPQDADYLTLFNALLLENPRTFEDYSTGIVEMLKCFVYFEYYTSTQADPSTQGLKKIDSSNSKNYPNNSHLMMVKYNLGVANYKVIQEYVCDNMETYPDYNGVNKNYSTTL